MKVYRHVKVLSPDNGHEYQDQVCFDEPNYCPQCNSGIKPYELFLKIYYDEVGTKKMSNTYLCQSCHNTFISQYYRRLHNNGESEYADYSGHQYVVYDFDYSAPNKFEEKTFDDEIKQLSNGFIIIYNQALQAECNGLNEIAGMGYRKAVEFLIKDYLIESVKKPKEIIEGKFLGNCIKDDIDDVNIKTLAERCAWLGNDEAHYVRRHTDRDVEDLKRFIDATVHWISMVLITKDAESMEAK